MYGKNVSYIKLEESQRINSFFVRKWLLSFRLFIFNANGHWVRLCCLSLQKRIYIYIYIYIYVCVCVCVCGNHFKDVVKNNPRVLRIDIEILELTTRHLSTQKEVIYNGCKTFEVWRIKRFCFRWAFPTQDLIPVPDNF